MFTVKNIKKNFGSRAILRDFSYTFPEKTVIALVGPNGAGKTTLLKILSGQDKEFEGQIIPQKGKTMGFLRQEPNPNPLPNLILECCQGNEILFNLKNKLVELEEKLGTDYSDEVLEAFQEAEENYRSLEGYAFEEKAKDILLGIGFSNEQLEMDPKDLSGGWRMRLEIAKLFMQNPDFLILDEPTNHLDLPSIEWIENYIGKFPGTILFVSHDESLLNSLPDRILSLKNGNLKEYVGNYEDYLEQESQDQEQKEKSFKNIQKKVKQLSKFVDRFKAKASLAKQAQSKIKVINRLKEEAEKVGANDIVPEVNIKIPLITRSGKEVLKIKGNIGYKDPLIKDIDLTIIRGQKIAVTGANGLGKSTTMKTMSGGLPMLNGTLELGTNVKMGYYAQDEIDSLDLEKSVIENMEMANPSIPTPKLLKILGSFLFRKDDVKKPCKVLSGGEKSRLSLASLLINDYNFIMLDEPTNHLDIMSAQILSNALSNFEGTVIFISHNRSFISNTATHLMVLENKSLNIFSNFDAENN